MLFNETINVSTEKDKKKRKYFYINGSGYIYQRVLPKTYRLQHRIILEKLLNRSLSSFEIVHHINGNRRDNNVSNLKIVDRARHIQIHSKKYLQHKSQQSLFTDMIFSYHQQKLF